MKKLLTIASIGFTVLLYSCAPTGWDEETKNNFKISCKDAVNSIGSFSATQQEEYCKCALEKVQEKYSNQQDAIANGPTLHDDNGPMECREAYLKK